MKIKALVLIMILVFTGGAYAESLANLQAIAKELEERGLALDVREKALAGKEERMKALEEELLAKESALRELKETISKRLSEIKKIEDENLDSLAKAYGSAKAKSAAEVISKMQLDKAVQLFLRMNAMTAGKIMSAMGKSNPGFAARLSNKLTPERVEGIDEE